MIPFIERDSDPQLPSPYSFPGVKVSSYQLAADWNKLNALCNETLNIGSLEERGFVYRALPLYSFVNLDVLTYPRMEDIDPRFSNRGYTTQHECYFRMFVVKYRPFYGFLLPVDISLFFPYMFVDESWSLISGREVVGLPKVLADFEVPDDPNGTIVVSTPVFPHYSAQTKLTKQPAVIIEPMQAGEAAKPLPEHAQGWPWGLVAGAKLDATHRFLFLEESEIVRWGMFSTVQLKQFRDAENDAYACYQALLRGEFTVRNIEFKAPPAPSRITIPPYDSLKIASNLGLQPAGAKVFTPTLEYTATCNMTYSDVLTEYVSSP